MRAVTERFSRVLENGDLPSLLLYVNQVLSTLKTRSWRNDVTVEERLIVRLEFSTLEESIFERVSGDKRERKSLFRVRNFVQQMNVELLSSHFYPCNQVWRSLLAKQKNCSVLVLGLWPPCWKCKVCPSFCTVTVCSVSHQGHLTFAVLNIESICVDNAWKEEPEWLVFFRPEHLSQRPFKNTKRAYLYPQLCWDSWYASHGVNS